MVAHGAALFLGAFAIVGAIGELRGRQPEIALWFVDVRDVAQPIQLLLLAAFGFLLAAWAIAPASRWARLGASIACAVVAVVAARDVIRYFAVVGGGTVRPAMPVPFSAVLLVLLVLLAAIIWRSSTTSLARSGHGGHRRAVGIVLAACCWAAAFPIAQIAFFGTTDYRRPAQAAVVFGARVYASGVPSPLLADRIATAVELYRSGLTPLMVMSGGDGADGYNEAAIMRDRAIAAGVSPDDVIADPAGVTTDATVENTIRILHDRFGSLPLVWVPVVAVSQPYHLPRIQLAFAGAGIDVLTVPAVDPVPIGEMPLLVAREVPAWWSYYLRACLGWD